MSSSAAARALPVIDVAPLIDPGSGPACSAVAAQTRAACHEHGFFYITGHSVPAGLLDGLEAASGEFFRLPLRAFTGSYGDYLLGKVSKVFPQLRHDVL